MLNQAKRMAVALGVAAALFGALPALAGMEPAPSAEPASFRYQLNAPGFVSAAVYDSDGKLVRTLLRGEKQSAGTHELRWDGLTRDGAPLPAGTYEWRVLRTPGFQAEFRTILGVNVKSKPWHTWVGNHGDPPSSVTVTPDGETMVVGSTVGENVPTFIAQSIDGRTRRWEQSQPRQGRGGTSLAIGTSPDGARLLYALQRNGLLNVLRMDDGAYQRQSGGHRRNAWPLLPEGDARRKARKGLNTGWDTMDLAAHDRIVVFADRDRGLVQWLDPANDRVLAEVNVPAAAGVAVLDEQHAAVIAGDRVMRVGRDGTSDVLIDADKLSGAFRLAYDRASGELLIAERAPGHQVKRFNLDGALLQTYGRAGGRSHGPYSPGDFRNIRDIVADGAGGFFVAESGDGWLRRLVHVDGAGEVVNPWYGGMPFYHTVSIDPADPTRVFFGNDGVKVLAKVDYDTGAYQILAEYAFPTLDGMMPPATTQHAHWRAVRRDGSLYLLNDIGQPAIVRVDEQAHRLVPVAVAGLRPADSAEPLREAAKHAGISQPDKARYWSWSDANADGVPQPAEFTFARGATPDRHSGFHGLQGRHFAYDAQWNVYLQNAYPGRNDHVAWFRLDNLAQQPGQAKWDWRRLRASRARLPGDIQRMAERDKARTAGHAVHHANDGSVYQLIHGKTEGGGDDAHGEGWPTREIGATRLARYDPNGNLAFSIGRHATEDPHNTILRRDQAPREVQVHTAPGEMHMPIRILGTPHGHVAVADKVVNPAMVWTSDGLYAGAFLDRRAKDGLPDELYAWWRANPTLDDKGKIVKGGRSPIPYDCLVGGSLHTTSSGEVLWFAPGNQGTPVYRITGWDGWSRQRGTLTLTQQAPHAKANGTGLSAAYFDNPTLRGAPKFTRLDPRIWFKTLEGPRRRGNWAWGFWFAPDADDKSRKQLDAQRLLEGKLQRDAFSARWTGQLEAPLSEPFVFSAYLWHEGGVRLWIDGKQVIDAWEPKQGLDWAHWKGFVHDDPVRRVESEPIALEAGRRYDVRIEYRSTGRKPRVGFNWESFSRERERIPTRYLYPDSQSQR